MLTFFAPALCLQGAPWDVMAELRHAVLPKLATLQLLSLHATSSKRDVSALIRRLPCLELLELLDCPGLAPKVMGLPAKMGRAPGLSVVWGPGRPEQAGGGGRGAGKAAQGAEPGPLFGGLLGCFR